MRKLRKLIHSPHHLFVFEAAARLQSFTHAASELGVSQPAVSLAIKQLEQAIGCLLFIRGHRSVRLTDQGERFYNDVAAGLGRILQTAEMLHDRADSAHVTLMISTAFANYWMVPRLSDFHKNHPDIDLRLKVVDKDLELAADGVSLGIRRGKGRWNGYQTLHLLDEILFPVASPAYLERSGYPENLAAMAKLRLIHLEEPFRVRPTWREWFAAQGFQYPDNGEGLRLNDYALVIQAAIAGEGIAFGWQHIVARLLEQGILKRVMPESWASGIGFYLIWPTDSNLTLHAKSVRDWIAENI